MKLHGGDTMSFSVIFLLYLLCSTGGCGAKPLSREKRVSDQRLAEWETRLALSKMKEKVVTVPIGFGRVNPEKLGKRRRRKTEEIEMYGVEDEELHTTDPLFINR